MKPKEYIKRLLQQDSMIVKFYIWFSQRKKEKMKGGLRNENKSN